MILWVLFLGGLLLVQWAILSYSDKIRPRMVQVFIRLLLPVTFGLLGVLLSGFLCYAVYQKCDYRWAMYYFSSGTLVFIMACFVLGFFWRRMKARQEENVTPGKKHRVLAVGLLSLCGAVITFLCIDSSVEKEFRTLNEKCRAEVEASWPRPVSSVENSALAYSQAVKMGGGSSKWMLNLSDKELDEKEMIFLKENQDIREQIIKGSRLKAYYGVLDWQNFQLRNMLDFRMVITFLARDVRFAMREKRYEDAYEDITAMSGVSGQLRQIPLLVPYMISTAGDVMMLDSLEYVLNQPHPPLPPDLVSVFNEGLSLKDFDHVIRMDWLLSGLHITGGLKYRILIDESALKQGWDFYLKNPSLLTDRYPDSPFIRVFLTRFVRNDMNQIVPLIPSTKGVTYQEYMQEWFALGQKIDTSPDWTFIMSNTLRNWSRAAKRTWIIDTKMELARAAIAIDQYYQKNKIYPEKWADVVPAYLPAIPQDPFSGQEMRMNSIPGGLTIYSIGPDQKDDGGQYSESVPFTKGDITFRFGTAYTDPVRK